MYMLTKISIGLGMIMIGLWLLSNATVVQAKSDTGYLGMGEWRTVISQDEDAC